MTNVNLRIHAKAKPGEAHAPSEEAPLFPEYAEHVQGSGELRAVGFLQGGTVKGEPSVCLMIEYPSGSGRMVAVETTAGLYLTMAAAMKGALARWGEPWEGA